MAFRGVLHALPSLLHFPDRSAVELRHVFGKVLELGDYVVMEVPLATDFKHLAESLLQAFENMLYDGNGCRRHDQGWKRCLGRAYDSLEGYGYGRKGGNGDMGSYAGFWA